MSARKPAQFDRFFWEGGEDGNAYYSKEFGAKFFWPALDPVKYKLAAAIGKINNTFPQSYFSHD